ncbi:MAG: lamin tail domain-containing protein [Muricauda sp.]|nr:lamin tail domain-containing protein [Allomuricauda sp.]
MKNILYTTFGLAFFLFVVSCVDNNEFGTPKTTCNDDLQTNITFAELDSLAGEETIQIKEDLVLEGYVISSDKAGNFYSELYLQEEASNPKAGLQIKIELSNSHLFYPVGSKVKVKLQDLYVKQKEDNMELGSAFSSFGNLSIGRLPAQKVMEHIYLSCDDDEATPLVTSIQALDTLSANILVKIENLEFQDEALGQPFAEPEEETERILQDCEENQIVLINSGYADFQAELLPEGNGSLTGILIKDGNVPKLIIRSLEDINFNNDRCPEIITEFTSNQIFISELADPDNNSGARFVELYNASTEPLDLNLWTLRRYTNDNTEVSSTVDLSGIVIGVQSTLVISPNAEEFELVYGFQPDLAVSTNSPADSNGDDNLELVDPFGSVIDVFGVIGEDGSNTNHEFEDGRAFRNLAVIQGNPVFTFLEWTIYNDTGDAGTIKLPQNAPQDFTPAQRE